jgi:hypothetical protein
LGGIESAPDAHHAFRGTPDACDVFLAFRFAFSSDGFCINDFNEKKHGMTKKSSEKRHEDFVHAIQA